MALTSAIESMSYYEVEHFYSLCSYPMQQTLQFSTSFDFSTN